MGPAAVVQCFAPNTVGRDFVVGDIHGCFDQLQATLDSHRFDPTRDRLFAVGDLIDRGPLSSAALGWLAQPWFHTCLGNHEAIRLVAPQDLDTLVLWLLLNGGEWWFKLAQAEREQFTTAFSQLPLAMEVKTPVGCVGIVHADVPAHLSWPEFIQALEAGDSQVSEFALWSRQRAEGLVTSPVAGIERVVCGHTVCADGEVRVVANVWFIDTGAFLQQGPAQLTVLPLSELF